MNTNDGSTKFAFYDLDYTIIPVDTILLFANSVLKRHPLRIFYLFFFLPLVPFAALKLVGAGRMKSAFFSLLWGMKSDHVEKLAREFVKTQVIPGMYADVLGILDGHKKEGRITVLNTASPSFYARYIAEELGFDHFYGTEFHTGDRFPLFLKLKTANNKRAVKILSMMEILPEEIKRAWSTYSLEDGKQKRPHPITPIPGAHSLTDSSADLPLLSLAGEKGFLIHPDKKLRALAPEKNWDILTPAGYTHGGIRKITDSLLQILGLYPELKPGKKN